MAFPTRRVRTTSRRADWRRTAWGRCWCDLVAWLRDWLEGPDDPPNGPRLRRELERAGLVPVAVRERSARR